MRIGYDDSSSWSPPVSGAFLPLGSELRGIRPSASCWRSNRKRVAARAVRGVAGHQQPGERLVQVAGEHLAVGPEVVGLAVGQLAGADRLAPRAAEPGRDRARERLVLAGLHHVDGQVVLLGEPQGLRGGQAGQSQRRALQPRVVGDPAGRVAGQGAVERRPGRGAGGADRGRGGLPVAERQGDRGVAAPVQLGGLHDVALRRVRRDRPERVVGVELGQPVGRGAGVAAGRGQERPVGPEGAEQRHAVVPVDRVGDRGGVRADQRGGGRVDGRVVGAAVERAAAAVAVDRGVVAHVELERARRPAAGSASPRRPAAGRSGSR